MGAHTQFRARLAEAGLEEHADALVAMAAPSLRLRSMQAGVVAGVAYRTMPVEVLGPDAGVIAIASGWSHTLALVSDGSVLAWGNNESGQLGDGTRTHRSSPVPVRGLTGVKALAAGGAHNLALCADGSVLAWGGNGGGALGDGTRTQRRTPVVVEGLDSGARAIFTGIGTSYAIMDDGAVLGWGINAGELLGIDESPDRPTPVPGIDADLVAIAAGGYRIALASDGSLVVWGWVLDVDSASGKKGWAPRALRGDWATISAIAAGYDYSVALTSEGKVLSWGDNRGKLGDGTTAHRRSPAGVAGLDGDVIAIAAGWAESFALRADGTVLAWGRNSKGELGDGTTIDRSTPVQVTGLPAVQSIAPRAALTTDGAVYEWGGEMPAQEARPEEHLPIGASKLGGSPDLPPDTSWPSLDQRPMAFIAQIALAELAPLDRDGLLPGAGLLSFFCALIDLGSPDAGQVLYTPRETPLVRTTPPAALAADEHFAPASLAPQADLTGAPWQSAQLERLGLSREQLHAYSQATGQDRETPMHRMLGHPEIVQNDPRDSAREMCLLLQVDSDESLGMMWGDVGRLYYWLDPKDLEDRHFDRCWLDFQCH